MDRELVEELSEMRSDKVKFEQELSSERERIAKMLKSSMGQDIHDVLSGKILVKESKWSNFKYKIKWFINRIFDKL